MIVQAPRRWVSSPLGINLLLAICGGSNARINKYVQMSKLLKNKKVLKSATMLYHTPCVKSDHVIKKLYLNEIMETSNMNTLHDWINGHVLSKATFDEEVSTGSSLILSNITIFKGSWSVTDLTTGPIMKIYNSFNYTQDVKYEAKILELPIQDTDFRLVIIVPNEADVFHNLFERLNSEGLTAAVNSVQPLFTATSELKAPSIDIESKIGLKCKNSNDALTNTAVQYATAKIDAKGVSVEVMTNMYSASGKIPPITEETTVENPFYFAITFQDMPIFTGKYTKQ